MSESHLCLYFLSLVFLFYVSPSSSFIIDDPVVGLVACRPRQFQAFTQLMSEFDTRGCNHSDNSNGVWCDNSTGAIRKLQLSGCLSGTLKPSSSLFNLHHLRHLNLSQNNFSSSLPSELGNLKRLQVLDLSSSGFLGQVPSSFNNLSQLSVLNLGRNDLTGSFPQVWNLTKLSTLSLSHNYFSGTLNTNTGLFGLHHLRYLNLGFNNFSSSLPLEFGNLSKLDSLFLSMNGFLGQVPPTISNLTRLSHLYLAGNDLTGGFPLVQNLTELSVLELGANSFYGTIPSSLFSLPFLSLLDLRQNSFTGSFEIPNFPTSSTLTTLFLGYNHFEAQILEPISKLINLTDLDIEFLNTSYPIDLGFLSSLKSLLYLDLSGNNIYPASLSSDSYLPVTLEKLYFNACGIRAFPDILKTLQNLEFLDLSRNKIKGKIPEWLWTLPRLGSVSVNGNSFSGFQGWKNVLVNSSVVSLLMDSNNFQGPLPDLPLSIQVISARSNNFTGEIPPSICNRSSLAVLELSYNNFTGPLPQCLDNVTYLNLRKNNLEGSIPDVFTISASLLMLDVGFNRITGRLPRSLVNCTSLMFLSVDNNSIEDTFPFYLKALPNLQVMHLRSNKFHGPISLPHQAPLGFPSLRIFEIADNKFNGSLSSSYFLDWKAPSLMMNEDAGLYMLYSKSLYDMLENYFTIYTDLQYKGVHMEQKKIFRSYSAIDLSGNLLDGDIPESIGALRGLIALNLSGNAFTGHIPLTLANLNELESLDLSRNQLSGTIPNGLGSLTFLAFINVSHNQLNGQIPQGTQITGQPKSSFEGNAGLCGLPLGVADSCFHTSPPPIQYQEEEEEDDEQVLNWKGVAIGYGLGVLFGLAITQVIVSYKPEWLAKIIGLVKRKNR